VDCHDGDYEPEVYHMKTLTSKVPVRDICQAINKYAFVTSPYPVIISTEVHCSIEQQERLGAIMRECFGDQLIVAPLDGIAGMVSPEQLKGRILFKASPDPPEDGQRPDAQAKPPSPKKTSTLEPLPSDTTSSTDTDSGFARLARRLSIGSSKEKEKPSFAPCLADLLVYTAGVKYQGFSKLVQYEQHQQFSVSEKTGTRIIRENKGDWVKHNFNHLSRIYPKGVRLASSNYDPTPFWQAGNQLVALNWQTIGKPQLAA
jgi:phosphatidylinositol phospholipase C delta